MNILNIITIKRIKPRDCVKYLKRYFKEKEVKGVELGVWKGENAEQLIKNLRIKKIELVDIWGTDNKYKEKDKLEKGKEAFKECRKRLHKCKDKIYYIMKSEDFLSYKKGKEKYDFIYIDANHEYKYVKKDIELSWKLIKKGGILCGDDFHCMDVAKAVVEFSKKIKQEPFIMESCEYAFKKE